MVLAFWTEAREVLDLNPNRVTWNFVLALTGFYSELRVLWAQREGWDLTAELHPRHGCFFESVALIT